MKKKASKMRIPFALDGLPFVIVALVAAAVCWFLSLHITVYVLLGLTVLLLGFFRDPIRRIRASDDELLSPADGKVIVVRSIDDQSIEGGKGTLICVFMSLLNCHVNRSPIKGEIKSVKHTSGKFIAAFKDMASEVNERNRFIVVNRHSDEVGVTQVAGLIARRIVCRIKPGDKVEAGQRIGMIKFGSRLDVVMPASYRASVEVGDKARAGLTVLGRRIADDKS
ncbi:phosphatidylserine decarboxylase family protein [bacterium]|nr:phosphatidylserine decarboxylase family protein [bacterium]